MSRFRLRVRILLDLGLGGGETGDGNAERGAGDVVDADRVEELDGLRIAAVLAADAAHQARAEGTALVHADLHQLADGLGVDGLERVGVENLVPEVVAHEGTDVITAEAEGHLGKVVRAEAEELGLTGHAVGGEGSTRDFDHRTELVVDERTHHGLDLGLDLLADGLLEAELTGGDGDRDHDLRVRVQTFLLEFGGGGEDGAVLGLGDQREADVQTDAAVAHHRVHLVEGSAALLDFLDGNAEILGEFLLLVLTLRHELVERRVQETEHDRLAVHHAERVLDGGLHEGLELG